jgi:hypothetical protein
MVRDGGGVAAARCAASVCSRSCRSSLRWALWSPLQAEASRRNASASAAKILTVLACQRPGSSRRGRSKLDSL